MNDLELLYRNLKYIKKSGDFNEVMKDDYNKGIVSLGFVNNITMGLTQSGNDLINLLEHTYDDKW